jgi:hypothetical protein
MNSENALEIRSASSVVTMRSTSENGRGSTPVLESRESGKEGCRQEVLPGRVQLPQLDEGGPSF